MRALVMAAAVFAASAAHAQTAPPPVEAFGRLPLVSDAELSPDGTKVALARYENGRAQVQIIDLDRRAVIFSAAADERDNLRDVGWADDARVSFVATRAVRPGEVLPSNYYFRGAPRRVVYERTGIIDIAARSMQILSTNPERPWSDFGSELIAPIEGSANIALMSGRALAEGASNTTLFRVDLRNGGTREFAANGTNRDTLRFLIGARGDLIARIDSNRASNRWSINTYFGDESRPIMEGVSETGAPPWTPGILPDGRLAVVSESGDFDVIYAVSRDDGAREIYFQREGTAIEGVVIDPWTRMVVGAAWNEVERRQHFFDPALQAIYEQARAAHGDAGTLLLTSWSRDRRRAMLYRENGLDGGGYYLFTPAEGQMLLLGRLYPELASAATGDRQALTYRARDGVRIPAYLTLPPALERRNLPLVLLVHGGPARRDTFDFDWLAAFLASRGYAVLQPNFRGSSGYGAAWERAGLGQWGGLMQTDVEDGVDALAQAGIADPSRVCIVGASYGGYAALAGATLTPEKYRCAASVNGVADLVEFLRANAARAGRDSGSADYWRLSIGDRQEDRARIASVSPANLADRVRAPILLIHGNEDTVVPIEQSRRMRSRLQSAGKEVRFVELRGDDHYLSDEATRIQMLSELETFLGANLGAPPQ